DVGHRRAFACCHLYFLLEARSVVPDGTPGRAEAPRAAFPGNRYLSKAPPTALASPVSRLFDGTPTVNAFCARGPEGARSALGGARGRLSGCAPSACGLYDPHAATSTRRLRPSTAARSTPVVGSKLHAPSGSGRRLTSTEQGSNGAWRVRNDASSTTLDL